MPRRPDYLGASIGDALRMLGESFARKLLRDAQQEETTAAFGRIQRASETPQFVQQETKGFPITTGGAPGLFGARGIEGDINLLGDIAPTALQFLYAREKAMQPKYGEFSPGSVITKQSYPGKFDIVGQVPSMTKPDKTWATDWQSPGVPKTSTIPGTDDVRVIEREYVGGKPTELTRLQTGGSPPFLPGYTQTPQRLDRLSKMVNANKLIEGAKGNLVAADNIDALLSVENPVADMGARANLANLVQGVANRLTDKDLELMGGTSKAWQDRLEQALVEIREGRLSATNIGYIKQATRAIRLRNQQALEGEREHYVSQYMNNWSDIPEEQIRKSVYGSDFGKPAGGEEEGADDFDSVLEELRLQNARLRKAVEERNR